MKGALLLLTGVFALAVLTSCGETAEVLPAETSTAQPSASGYSAEVSPTNTQTPTLDNLPSPAGGYKWYVYPQSQFGLPRYAIEIPANWRAAYPGESNPQVFIPVDSADIDAGQSILAYSSLVQPADKNFTFLLPGQGGSCGIASDRVNFWEQDMGYPRSQVSYVRFRTLHGGPERRNHQLRISQPGWSAPDSLRSCR